MYDIYCVILFDPFVPQRLLLVTSSTPSSAKDGATTPSRDDEEEGKPTDPVSASAISNKFRTLSSFTIESSDPPLALVFFVPQRIVVFVVHQLVPAHELHGVAATRWVLRDKNDLATVLLAAAHRCGWDGCVCVDHSGDRVC
jgi:hypothetical protein